jgi:hypothetical protein
MLPSQIRSPHNTLMMWAVSTSEIRSATTVVQGTVTQKTIIFILAAVKA